MIGFKKAIEKHPMKDYVILIVLKEFKKASLGMQKRTGLNMYTARGYIIQLSTIGKEIFL
ncbi:MAG: hypothetical protein GXO64_02185 [Candidatus Micrarchaeota archaeon]|nr:hypothetical protein [Candidatus Micrarchaeota archaeon]